MYYKVHHSRCTNTHGGLSTSMTLRLGGGGEAFTTISCEKRAQTGVTAQGLKLEGHSCSDGSILTSMCKLLGWCVESEDCVPWQDIAINLNI